MQAVTTVGLDIAKSIFQVHGVNAEGRCVIRQPLRRSRVLGFFKKLSPCLVGIEACASSHHWSRELQALGHTVRLMPPAYVRPYVKRQKNDAADAEAICEAVQRPSMRFVPTKTPDQQSSQRMAEERVQRRLAAILAADVVGYSRLMGTNEAATLAALKTHRKELVDAKIAEHQGRIFKLTGDGMLVEFTSVVNAVACAVDIQHKMRERNIEVPEDRRIEFRIGVNVGDIIVEENDIYGDGVNMAARLEAIAEPGGIVVSSAVHDHVGNRVDVAFDDIGEQVLKNIDRPVRVYSVLLGTHSPAEKVGRENSVNARSKVKPTIAVLPFTNMSGDSEQEYFADGITEDIITDLSKVSGLSVIARNSVFTYKNKSADVQEVSKRFNVTTILEGSVRKAGRRVRINAQLIDCNDGTHLWSERYDRDLTDIFAIQDEITQTIVEQLRVRLLPKEKQAIEAAPTGNVDAYSYYLQGRHFYHFHTISHALLAQRMFKEAVELDPGYARAYAGLADCASFLFGNHNAGSTPEEGLAASAKALELDPNLAEAHAAHGMALHRAGRNREAVDAFERAIGLNPNLFETFYHYTETLRAIGDREKAAKMYARGAEIEPGDFRCPVMLSQIYGDLGRHQESREAARIAIVLAERALAAYPDIPLPAAFGALALVRLGERARALDWASRALMIAPDDPLIQYNIACTYSVLGELDRAIDLLERWRARGNAATKDWIVHDTDFDNIREHPRYRKLLEHVG